VSRENVDLVRSAFEAWSAGDVEKAMSALDADVEWNMAEDEPDARTLHGQAEVLEMLGGWVESFEEFSSTPRSFIDGGEHVIVPITFAGRPRGGDTTVTIEETQVYTVQSGTVVRVREFRTEGEAHRAVGLPR
jgi:ketosteroid isomerase-like protein